ncbi:DUF4268 domain-containing protein [Vreelandella rituensis]
MVNMGELFKHPRIDNVPMDRAPLTDKELAISLLQKGDLLFARQSLVREGAGKCSIFLDDKEPVCFESHLIRCRLNHNDYNPLFYFYYFDSPLGKQAMDTIIEQGAGAAGIRGSDLANLQVPVYSIDFQNAVATILDGLERKIQLNHQINQTLEKMAQTLFKSWFVDFEPVKAKVAALEAGGSEEDALLAAMETVSGKTADQLATLSIEQSERHAELRATAELFPSAMQDSELNEIPEGWESGYLSDICDFQNGYAFKSKDWSDSGFPVVKIGSVKPAFVDTQSCSYVQEETVAGLERFELYGGDLLIGMTGYPGETGLVPITENRMFLNQRVGRLKPKQYYQKALLYCNARDSAFKQYVEGQAHGSAQANVSGKAISQYPLTIPIDSIVQRFSELIEPLLQQKLILHSESSSLSSTRDILLPKLLSGELTLPDVNDEAHAEPQDVAHFHDVDQIIPAPNLTDSMVIKKAKKQSADTQQTHRPTLRLMFWEKVLDAFSNCSSSLYNNVRPSKIHWLSMDSGIKGIAYHLIFDKNEIGVGLCLQKNEEEANNYVYERLNEQKNEIEASYGYPLVWWQLNCRLAFRLQHTRDIDSYDRANWPEMIDWMVTHMTKLENALHVPLKAINQHFNDVKARRRQNALKLSSGNE